MIQNETWEAGRKAYVQERGGVTVHFRILMAQCDIYMWMQGDGDYGHFSIESMAQLVASRGRTQEGTMKHVRAMTEAHRVGEPQ